METVFDRPLDKLTDSLNGKIENVYTYYMTQYCTPFYVSNSAQGTLTFTFSNFTENEGMNVMLFTRYAAYLIHLTINSSTKIESAPVVTLYGTERTATISSDGKSFSITIGTWASAWGFVVHPWYPNLTFTTSKS